jgi:diaminopimelate epimerase
MIKFSKYHGLGNDYLVIEPGKSPERPSAHQIRLICDRHYGAGSDGILFGPLPADQADFALRIFNPDGSEAEKSGNGLRIFSRYLWDHKLVKDAPFHIQTAGGIVQAQVLENGAKVTVEMGQASFDSQKIPVTGPPRQVIDEIMEIGDELLHYCAVTMGNPHCVVICSHVDAELAHRLGPLIETEARFPNRTNVQFMKVLDRQNIQIEIWERGAGYTLASGSSSCAAAAAAHRLGLCEAQVTVHNPGGQISIFIAPDFSIRMTGPVQKVYDGQFAEGLL